MADAIIKFPGAAVKDKKSAETKTIKDIFEQASPAGSTAYPVMQVFTVPQKIETKPDFATGRNRNPHWGMMMSLSLIPDFSKVPAGSVMLPQAPSQFVTADTLEEIRERVIFELDKSIAIAKIAQDNPEAYKEYEREMLARITQDMQEQE